MTKLTPKGCWRLIVTFTAVIAVPGGMPTVSDDVTPWVLFEIGRLIVVEVKMLAPEVLVCGPGVGAGVRVPNGRPCKSRPPV